MWYQIAIWCLHKAIITIFGYFGKFIDVIFYFGKLKPITFDMKLLDDDVITKVCTYFNWRYFPLMDIFGHHLDFNGRRLFIVFNIQITNDFQTFLEHIKGQFKHHSFNFREHFNNVLQFLNKCRTSVHVRTVENSRVLSNGCGSVRKALNAMESFFMSHINRRNDWPKNVNLLALWTDF